MAEEAAFQPAAGALGPPDAAAAFSVLFQGPPQPSALPPHMQVPCLSEICQHEWMHVLTTRAQTPTRPLARPPSPSRL